MNESTDQDPHDFEGGAEKDETKFPSIAALQNDIASANLYRIELLKTAIVLAGALFAFAITTTSGDRGAALADVPCNQSALWNLYAQATGAVAHSCRDWARTGVLLSGVAMFLGLLQLRLWTAFYLTYRGIDWKLGRGKGKSARSAIGGWRLLSMILLVMSFIASMYVLWIVYVSGA